MDYMTVRQTAERWGHKHMEINYKMGKGENLNTDVLFKMCIALDCSTGDIMEVVDDF